MKYWVIFFYGKDTAETYELARTDIELIDKVREYTKSKRLFAVYRLGECIGDFS